MVRARIQRNRTKETPLEVIDPQQVCADNPEASNYVRYDTHSLHLRNILGRTDGCTLYRRMMVAAPSGKTAVPSRRATGDGLSS